MEKIKPLTSSRGLSEAEIRLHMLKTYRDMMAEHCPRPATLLAADVAITELTCQVENTPEK